MRGFNTKEQIKRVRYFDGQMITSQDLAAEQEYFLRKMRRHNRNLHGAGIVAGLDVSILEDLILVSPGYALDCVGDEIFIESPVELHRPVDQEPCYLILRYVERTRDRVPVPFGDQEKFENSRVEEGYELIFATEETWAAHEAEKGCWTPRGKRHGIPLAKLVFKKDGWKMDDTFIRPTVR